MIELIRNAFQHAKKMNKFLIPKQVNVTSATKIVQNVSLMLISVPSVNQGLPSILMTLAKRIVVVVEPLHNFL